MTEFKKEDKVNSTDVKQVLYIIVGLAIFIGVFTFGFAQTGILFGATWAVFLILLIGSILIFTGLFNTIRDFFRKKKPVTTETTTFSGRPLTEDNQNAI